MPTIYDNITGDNLEKALNMTLTGAKRTDFYIGHFNLRGWIRGIYLLNISIAERVILCDTNI